MTFPLHGKESITWKVEPRPPGQAIDVIDNNSDPDKHSNSKDWSKDIAKVLVCEFEGLLLLL